MYVFLQWSKLEAGCFKLNIRVRYRLQTFNPSNCHGNGGTRYADLLEQEETESMT